MGKDSKSKEKMTKKNHYWVYILECENGCYYTGYTTDLVRRYKQHVAGSSASKYTRSFKPKRIAQCWEFYGSVGEALKIEQFIKKQTRKFKEQIVDLPHELKSAIFKRMNLKLEIKPVDVKSIKEENKK